MLETARRLTDFLGQLANNGVLRWLARHVSFSGRDLPELTIDGCPILANEVDLVAVKSNSGNGAGMTHDIPPELTPVGPTEPSVISTDNGTLVDQFISKMLKIGGHVRSASAQRASVCSVRTISVTPGGSVPM